MKKIFILFTLLLVTHHSFASKKYEPQERVLFQTDKAWNGQKYVQYTKGTPELIVKEFVIKPHTVLGWHQHPFPSVGKILEGSITLEDASGKKSTYVTGDIFSETVNATHRGIVGPKGVKILASYSAIKNMNISIPVNM